MLPRTLGIALAGAALTGTGLTLTSQHTGGPPQVTVGRTLAASPGPAAADRAAVAFVRAHHPGPGTTRVLATEPDTDRGVASYDVRVLGPDKAVYVVHIRRGTDTVLSASRAENQTAVHADSADRSDTSQDRADVHSSGHTSQDRADAPGHSTAGSAVSSDRQHHQDG